jgi:hypothetical protein
MNRIHRWVPSQATINYSYNINGMCAYCDTDDAYTLSMKIDGYRVAEIRIANLLSGIRSSRPQPEPAAFSFGITFPF